jgi:hypothetical protein
MELEVFGWRCQHSHQVECHHCNANSRWSVGSLEVKIEASGGQQAPPGWCERRRHSLASVVRMERPPLRNTDGMTTGFAAKKPIVLLILCSVSSGIVISERFCVLGRTLLFGTKLCGVDTWTRVDTTFSKNPDTPPAQPFPRDGRKFISSWACKVVKMTRSDHKY